MRTWNRLAKALSVVLPAGAVGASVVLALASSGAASAAVDPNATSQPPSGQSSSAKSLSVRLQEIRIGVSDMTGSAGDGLDGDAKATPAWWGNGGWGRWGIGWGNGGWHNGGWGNGGWHNAGWGNGGWHNYWHNW